MQKFTFFDLETPNRQNDKICSFGLIHMIDGEICFEREYFVNPDTYFDAFNVELHGVSPDMVKEAPTFDAIWPEIKGFFQDAVVVAHNATFDLTVLSKVLYYYDIEVPPLQYSCTWQMAKQRLKVPKYSLDALCAHMGIPLNRHHNAMEDTYACMGIFTRLYAWFEYLPSDIVAFIPRVDHRFTRKKDKVPNEALEYFESVDFKRLEGLLFCLSGNFKYGSKAEVAAFLKGKGAKCHPSVTQAVDVLLVGTYGHDKWSFGTFGTKVMRAKQMKAAGHRIRIIDESALFKKFS